MVSEVLGRTAAAGLAAEWHVTRPSQGESETPRIDARDVDSGRSHQSHKNCEGVAMHSYRAAILCHDL